MSRRRRQQRLERVLGTPALFSTAHGNVGSSIDSAFFVPHYLSIFWGPLRENPWDIVGGAIVIAFLVLLNVIGIQESANVNIGLALVDFATQVLLVLLGFTLIFSPHVLASNVHWGV